jgi:hypothetical protein
MEEARMEEAHMEEAHVSELGSESVFPLALE